MDDRFDPVWWSKGPDHRSKTHKVVLDSEQAVCGQFIPAPGEARLFYDRRNPDGMCQKCADLDYSDYRREKRRQAPKSTAEFELGV